jgi:hypothetical protein
MKRETERLQRAAALSSMSTVRVDRNDLVIVLSDLDRAEAALIAIRAGSMGLAAAGIVGHLHVIEQCSAVLPKEDEA